MNTLDRESLDYTSDVSRAFRCPHTLAALEAYTSLRRSLVCVDDMSEGALRALCARVVRAADKYPDEDGKVIKATNAVLRAYATMLSAVMWERDHVG